VISRGQIYEAQWEMLRICENEYHCWLVLKEVRQKLYQNNQSPHYQIHNPVIIQFWENICGY